jgi:protein-tyrosine phosphatase
MRVKMIDMTPDTPPTRVLMVCMGNICRSPTAEAVLRGLAQQQGLGDRVVVDSAGTGGAHAGEAPDRRAQKAAMVRGYGGITQLKARVVVDADFERFDHILAMDADNLAQLQRRCPPHLQHKLGLFLEAAGVAVAVGTAEVPDPYYGNAQGFERVLDLCEAGARGLLDRLG